MYAFSPLSIDPALIKLMTWNEIQETFFDKDESTQDDSSVLLSEDHAVKIIQNHDPQLSNELSVSAKLNELSRENLTNVFNFTSGYILSTELPPHIQMKPLSFYVSEQRNYVDIPAHHYVYVFSQKILHAFETLPDEPKINEDFYFEILIGLYYARQKFKFSHWDIHTGNLMYNWKEKKASRTYKIGGQFFVTIRDTHIEPKLVDYGKSVADLAYTDDQWKEQKWRKFWNKSDIYHLSLIISHRVNLSERFRQFLERNILPKFRSSMYATKLEKDSAANHKNIEDILLAFFGENETVHCMVCDQQAEYQAKVGNLYFCGEGCLRKYI